jgi:hypothetical protein
MSPQVTGGAIPVNDEESSSVRVSIVDSPVLRHSKKGLDRMLPCPDSSSLKSSKLDCFSNLRSRQTPSPMTIDLIPCHVSIASQLRGQLLTFQKCSSKVDTGLTVPQVSPLTLDNLRNPLCFKLLQTSKNALLISEANDNSRDSQ